MHVFHDLIGSSRQYFSVMWKNLLTSVHFEQISWSKKYKFLIASVRIFYGWTNLRPCLVLMLIEATQQNFSFLSKYSRLLYVGKFCFINLPFDSLIQTVFFLSHLLCGEYRQKCWKYILHAVSLLHQIKLNSIFGAFTLSNFTLEAFTIW